MLKFVVCLMMFLMGLLAHANEIEFCTHDSIVRRDKNNKIRNVSISCASISDTEHLGGLLISRATQEVASKFDINRRFDEADGLGGKTKGTGLFAYIDLANQQVKIAKNLPYPPKDYVVWNATDRKNAWRELGLSEAHTLPIGYVATNDALVIANAERKILEAYEDLKYKFSADQDFGGSSALKCAFVANKMAEALRICIKPRPEFNGLGLSQILNQYTGIQFQSSGDLMTLGNVKTGTFYAVSSNNGVVYEFSDSYPLKGTDGYRAKLRMGDTGFYCTENYSATTDSYLDGVYMQSRYPKEERERHGKMYPEITGQSLGIGGNRKFQDLLNLKIVDNFLNLQKAYGGTNLRDDKELLQCISKNSISAGGINGMTLSVENHCSAEVALRAQALNNILFGSTKTRTQLPPSQKR